MTALAYMDAAELDGLHAELETHRARAKVAPMTISHAADLWLGELARQGKSERTVDTYRRLVDKLSDHYPHLDVADVTTEQLRRFLDNHSRRKDGKRKAPALIAQQVSIIAVFFRWLAAEGMLRHNPTERNGMPIISRPKLQVAHENDNVVTVSTATVVRMLEIANASGRWNRRLAVNIALFLGPRRHAIATLRRRDYDPDQRMLTFQEKGDKTIRKPVPDGLAVVLDAAIAAGVYESEDDYLIPSDAQQRRQGERDDRVIWRIVKEVAADAGVDCHVHALRAAFAVAFLEAKPGEVIALKDLMGHSRLETTLIYLRRLNRQKSMETVRDFAWPGNDGFTEIPGKLLEAKLEAEKEGFEPSFPAESHGSGPGTHYEGSAP